MAGLFNEIDVKGLYGGVKAGAPLSTEEAQSLGLPQLNPLQDALERIYKKHITEDPEQNAAHVWSAQRVGVPQWIQDRDEMYRKEAEARVALLDKGSPDWKMMVAFSPATANFLSFDDAMSAAYDDTHSLEAMESESKRVAVVKGKLNGLLQRGASGRNAIIRSLRSISPPPAPAAAAQRSTAPLMGRDTIITDESNPFKQMDVALGNWFSGTDLGKGFAMGREMAEVGIEASNLLSAESMGQKIDESKWVELTKRKLALDRDAPSDWFGGMLYESGKMIGQQRSAAIRTSTMAATGAILGAVAAGATAPFSLPAVGVIAGMTSLLGWKIGADLGVFTQSAQIEGGFDAIDRRMMKDADGNYLSPMAVGLGSMTTGAINGMLETAKWIAAFSPLGKTAAAAKINETIIPRVASRISRLPAFVKMAGMTARNIVANDFFESGTEVLQDAVPIAIDEFQKAALLDGYDARTIGDINAQLINTFTQSLYSFALISAIGPIGAGLRGDYRAELGRKEMEAYQTQSLNDKLDNFNASIGATKLLKRIPGMTADFASELLNKADVRKIFLPASKVQTLFQDGRLGDEYSSAEEWAHDVLEVDPKDFRDSLDGGPEIEVEAIKLFDKIPDPIQNELRSDMRFSADGMTLGEAQALGEKITRLRNTDLFNTAYDIERETRESKSALKVYDALRLQLASNGMDDETASNTAWLASRMYVPLARMWNEKRHREDQIMPEDVAEMFPITFSRNEDGSTGMYFQAIGGSGAAALDTWQNVFIRRDNLNTSRQMEKEGMHPRAIKLATGWERGADTLWRMETDDSDFTLKALPGSKAWRDLFYNEEKYGTKRFALLKNVASYDELFAAYPDLGETRLFVDIDDDEELGYYSARTNSIHLNYDVANDFELTRTVILHEIQHAIQAKEGFARGGNVNMFNEPQEIRSWRSDLAEAEDYAIRTQNPFETGAKIELARLLERYGVKTIDELRNLHSNDTAFGQYNRLSGEVEARNTERRRNMTAEERRASLMSETEDVSREDQIILDSMLRKAELADELRYFQAAYHQAQMNRDVDLSRKISVLDLTEEKNISSDVTMHDITNYLKDFAANNAEFNDLLSDALISIIDTKVRPKTGNVKRKIREIASHISASGGHVSKGSKDLRKAALIAVDRLINHSVLIESVPNYKSDKKPDVAMYHYLYTPVSITENGKQKTYTLQIIAEEDINKQGRDPLKLDLYDLSVRKNISPLRAALPSLQGQPMWQPGDTEISIGEMLHKVKNFWGEDLNQSHRGSITLPRQPGQPVRISWGKDADASTVVHELAHFYLWQLRQFRSAVSAADRPMSKQNRRVADDLETIARWWGESSDQITEWMKNQEGISDRVRADANAADFDSWLNDGMETGSELGRAFDTAAHEYFARGFEAYLREGKAPTSDLQSVFRRFKAWLVEIYRNLTSLDVGLSDDMRAVYDRMLASEDAIDQFRAEMDIESVLNSDEDVDMEDVMAPYADDDPYEAAKERLLADLLNEISPERRKEILARSEEIRPGIMAQVISEKPWKTIQYLNDSPEHRISETSVVDMYGEETYLAMPEGTTSQNGISVEYAAKDLGYASADDLMQDIKGKLSVTDEVDARVRARIDKEFTSAVDDPAKLDAAAEAAWYEGEEHSDDLAADVVVPMSEYAGAYADDEMSYAEADNPRERSKVLLWVKDHGKINYSSVGSEFGKEQAQLLMRKIGPGYFSKVGFGLDELAQEMSGNGIPVGSDEALFRILMSENAKMSPIEAAKKEGREEAKLEERQKKALKVMAKKAAAEREKVIKKKYNAEIKELRGSVDLAAKNIVIGMTVEELKDAKKFIKAEKENRRKADSALRKGDENDFRHWRQRELVAHTVIRQIFKSRRQAEYLRTWIERYAKRTNSQTFGMTQNYLEQIDAILTRFDMRKTRSLTSAQRSAVEAAPSLESFVKEMDAEGTPVLIPDWILNNMERRHFSQLMLWQLEDIKNVIKNIATVGRQERETISLEKNVKLQDIAAQIYDAAKSFWGKRVTGEKVIDPDEAKKNLLTLAKGYLEDIETVEAMCRALDGYRDIGPAHQYIFQPVRDAVTRETLELNRVFALAREIRNKAYGGNPRVDNWKKTFNIPKYKRIEIEPGKYTHVTTDEKLTLTREQAICAVLNMGNEGNMARLRDGWGWTQDNMTEILNSLSEEDVMYVDGVWKLLESLWPQIKKVNELMTGLSLEKVEPQKLVTRYGTLAGGYYPIVTDLRYSTTAAAQNEMDNIMASATLSFAYAQTKSGHRKARAVDVLGRPPLLSLGVLDNHLANVIHDAEVAPALRDVRKILKNQLVETVIDEVLGKDRRSNINKWLNDVAANTKNNGVSLSNGEIITNKVKSGVAMFSLGGNISGALMQPLGYFALAHRIGPVQTARAIIDGLMDNTAGYEFVLSKSKFMAEQYRGQNLEVRKLKQNWSSTGKDLNWISNSMIEIYPMLQNLCNIPGWNVCYKIGLERFNNEADAIAYADSVIRQTQSASGIADLTTLERSGMLGSLVTMFFSWFRVMYQMQNEAIMKAMYGHGIKRFNDLASYAFYILIAQQVAEALLRGNGPDDDPDDDDSVVEKWVKWTAQRMLLAPLTTIPGVRDIVSMSTMGQYRFTPVEAAYKSVNKLVMTAYKALIDEKHPLEPLVWATAETFGYTKGKGIPNRMMIKAAKAFWAAYDEDEAIPWGYLIMGGGYKPTEKNN